MQKPVTEAPSSIHSQQPLATPRCHSAGEGASCSRPHHAALLGHGEEGTKDTPVLSDLQDSTEWKSGKASP